MRFGDVKSNEVEDALIFVSVVIGDDGGAVTAVTTVAADDGGIILKDDVFVTALWDESFGVESSIVVLVVLTSTVFVVFLVMLKLCMPSPLVVFSVLLEIED